MAYRKLGRNSSNRKALFRSILTSFFKYGKIETTVTKAKEVAKHSAQLILWQNAMTCMLVVRLWQFWLTKPLPKKLFEEIAPKYEGRQGGFTRIYRVGPRRGDAAEMAIIELI